MTLTVTNVVEVVTNICVRRGPAGLEWRRPDEGSNLDDLCDRDRYRRGGAKAAPSRRSGNVRMRDLRRLLSAPDVRPPVLAGTRSAGPTEGRPRPPPPSEGKRQSSSWWRWKSRATSSRYPATRIPRTRFRIRCAFRSAPGAPTTTTTPSSCAGSWEGGQFEQGRRRGS